MNIEKLKNTTISISTDQKEELQDVQNHIDHRGITVQRVGIKDFKIPLKLQEREGDSQIVTASVTMGVELPKEFKGTHMSRFIEILNEWKPQNFVSIELKYLLMKTCDRLDARGAYISLKFPYFIYKTAPKSKLKSLMDYNCEFEASIYNNYYQFILGLEVPITTVCPCSREISDFGAHNQRGIIRVKIRYDSAEVIWIENLVSSLESIGSSPVYSLLKREDEKFVTEKAYNNPKFVEDILRDTVLLLKQDSRINWFEVECENAESIHNHAAYAYYNSGFEK